jgi:hypothetical protein
MAMACAILMRSRAQWEGRAGASAQAARVSRTVTVASLCGGKDRSWDYKAHCSQRASSLLGHCGCCIHTRCCELERKGYRLHIFIRKVESWRGGNLEREIASASKLANPFPVWQKIVIAALICRIVRVSIPIFVHIAFLL